MDDVNVIAKYDENIDVKVAKAEEIMSEGGFKFKSWVKNGDIGEKELGKSETSVTKSLGMFWKTKNQGTDILVQTVPVPRLPNIFHS